MGGHTERVNDFLGGKYSSWENTQDGKINWNRKICLEWEITLDNVFIMRKITRRKITMKGGNPCEEGN